MNLINLTFERIIFKLFISEAKEEQIVIDSDVLSRADGSSCRSFQAPRSILSLQVSHMLESLFKVVFHETYLLKLVEFQIPKNLDFIYFEIV